jgi:hypothetical protein
MRLILGKMLEIGQNLVKMSNTSSSTYWHSSQLLMGSSPKILLQGFATKSKCPRLAVFTVSKWWWKIFTVRHTVC